MEDKAENNLSSIPASDRFQRAARGLMKPKQFEDSPGGRLIVEEQRKREIEIEACARMGMTALQMVDFLPARGIRMSQTAIYNTLGRIKLPKRYKPGNVSQSHHDFFTLSFLSRIGRDTAAKGQVIHAVSKGQSPGEDARFRPDLKFMVDSLLFYAEMQLSDLADTRWRAKALHYIRWYEKVKEAFRVLVIVDQRRDMAGVRRHFRNALKDTGHPDLNLFYFILLDELKSERYNLAYDPVWRTANGEYVSLLRS